MSRTSYRSVLLASLVIALGASACTSLLGTFEVGTGGSGGTAGASTGGSTIVDCHSQECCVPEDCAPIGSECKSRTCVSGACGTQSAHEGLPLSRQVAGDCLTLVCGDGDPVPLPDNGDIMDDGVECTVDACAAGSPVHTNIDAGTPCPVTTDHYCDGNGACVECTEPAHCASNVCEGGACVPASCVDGVKNAGETDIDCGGPCKGCDTGQPCGVATDCFHGVCGVDATCTAPTCVDGVKNGGAYLGDDGETDVDCGGPCGATCGPLEGCELDADCVGAQCSGSICVPNCFDAVKNNAESDVDCGGACALCTLGQTCGAGSDCESGLCADGLCCDAACDGECEACAALTKGSGVDGECGVIAAGTDPEDECDVEDPSTCGDSDGLCSGVAGCNKHPIGTACGDPASCAAGVQTNQDTCSGAGSCVDNGTTPCGNYACGGTACNTVCGSDADCAMTAYCPAGLCVPKLVNGSACATASVCASGFCADGFCCDAMCGALCQACSAAKKGSGVNGVCGNIANATDPDAECAGVTNCNGAGACTKLSPGAPCSLNAECSTSFCVDAFCCNTACGALCQACSAAKKGQGTNGTCGAIIANTDPDNECTTECNGASACELVNGTACTLASQCQSNNCVDGFCCDTACNGICQACSAAKKGSGTNGTCGNVANATDPDAECVGVTTCNGSGACTQLAPGAACTLAAECASGNCPVDDGVCCDQPCTFTCTACTMAKTGQPNGTCANVTAGTDPDVECIGVTNCNGSGACLLLVIGSGCTLNAECASNFCVDGVCCNTACGALCQACSAAKKGQGTNGTCGAIIANSDPDNECTTECNGASACEAPQGTACTLNTQCQSGFCVDGFCCSGACNTLCQACSLAKTGSANGTCANVTPGTDPDNECSTVPNLNCAAGGVCGP